MRIGASISKIEVYGIVSALSADRIQSHIFSDLYAGTCFIYYLTAPLPCSPSEILISTALGTAGSRIVVFNVTFRVSAVYVLLCWYLNYY